jgi:hypothetical protein
MILHRTALIAVSAVCLALLGATTASSDTTGPPVSTDRPTVTGSPGVGKTLRTTNGSWSTSASFTYQWLRCVKGYRACADPSDPSTYTVIQGATAPTYKLVAADGGHIVMALVTATNVAGSASALSSGKGPVEARPPGVKHKPWIGGTKRAWQTVYETDDRWTRSPYKWKNRWLRCSAKGNACVAIRGVQCSDGFCIQEPGGSTYQLTGKDVGHRIRVQVTAWNGAGRTTSTSNPTRIIKK